MAAEESSLKIIREDGAIEPYGRKRSDPISWQCAQLVMSVFFALAAYVQGNDPDPWIWIPVYGLPAILTLCSVFKPVLTDCIGWRWTAKIHALLCSLLSLFVLIQYTQKREFNAYLVNPLQYEEGRELAGLLIVIAWLCALLSYAQKRDMNFWKEGSTLLHVTIILSCFPLFLWALCYLDEVRAYIGICKGMSMD